MGKKAIAMLICVCGLVSVATIYITTTILAPKQEHSEYTSLEIIEEKQEENNITVLEEQEPLELEYVPSSEPPVEKTLMPDENEGVKIVVSDEIKEYIDENGSILPADPREDKGFKEEWNHEFEAIQYMALPPIDITYCNTYTFYMDKSSVESGLLEFMKKYLERTSSQATSEYMDNANGRYKYTLKKLAPNEYPDVYPVSPSKDLIQLVFSSEIQ